MVPSFILGSTPSTKSAVVSESEDVSSAGGVTIEIVGLSSTSSFPQEVITVRKEKVKIIEYLNFIVVCV